MKKIELVALTQLLGKISSGSISHDERKGLLEVMKVAKYNLEMRDEKMRTAMKKYGIEIDPNTGRIAEAVSFGGRGRCALGGKQAHHLGAHDAR